MVKRILIVDDSVTARMMIRRCLEFVGFSEADFFEAGNGREALKLLRAEPVDIVLTDINMPEMDGMMLVRRLKSSPRLHDIPVIVISSVATDEEEADLLSRGVSAVIRKPLSPMVIKEAFAALDASL